MKSHFLAVSCAVLSLDGASCKSATSSVHRCDVYLAPLKTQRENEFRTGVYAGRKFRQSELIEVTPSILLKSNAIHEWQVYDYSFETENNQYEMHLLGSAMIYARRGEGNIHHFWTNEEVSEIPLAPPSPFTDFDEVSFFAKTDISRGEEMTLTTSGVEYDAGNNDDEEEEPLENPYASYSLEELHRVGQCISDVYVDDSDISQAGKGLFSKRFFEKGEVVTVSPVFLLPRHKVEKQNPNSLLINYCISRNDSDVALLPTGLAGMMNHNNGENGDIPNIRMEWHSWNSPGGRAKIKWEIEPLESAEFPPLYIRYIAERNIYPDEELTISYGEDWSIEWNKYDESLRNLECPLGDEKNEDSTEPQFRHFITAPEGFFPPQFTSTCIGKNKNDCPLLEAKRKISLDEELQAKFNDGPAMAAAYRDKIHNQESDNVPKQDICKQSRKEMPLVYSKINPPNFDDNDDDAQSF